MNAELEELNGALTVFHDGYSEDNLIIRGIYLLVIVFSM
jgi:hypothetical protein